VEIVIKEMQHRRTSRYANLTQRPIPDTIYIEDGKLVALELEKKPNLGNIRRKMKLYESQDYGYDKVIIVWYTPDGVRRKEWILENGNWSKAID
jgi:hypothetical protein